MKKILSIAFTVLIIASCNQKELTLSENENDSLLAKGFEKDTAIVQFIDAFNEIENNLDSVAALQQVLYLNTDKPNEFIPNKKANINLKIQAINRLMANNRLKIVELNLVLANAKYKNKALVKTIATLNKQLVQKDCELEALNLKLDNLNVQVADLNVELQRMSDDNKSKDEIISKDIEALHTAYYLIGKKDELIDAKIIDRKGGLLGMGRTSKLSADFDNSKFNIIDYTKTTSMNISSRCKIITSHPSNSYVLESDAKDRKVINQITILNPDKFWSTSKYLVIVKE